MQDLAEESHFAPGEVRRFYDETFIARKQKIVFHLDLLYLGIYYLEILIPLLASIILYYHFLVEK